MITKLSVIIPVYNVEMYISKCLNSLIIQTMKDIEIICIDDCSTDDSANIIEQYIKKDNRIKLIKNKENKGSAQTRNIGISASECDYIAFVDSDDYVSKNYIEDLYNIAIRYSADITFTNNIVYVKGKKSSYPDYNRVKKWQKEYHDNPLKGLSSFNITWKDVPSNRECLSINAVKVFAKRFLTNYNLEFSQNRISEDSELLYKALAHKPTIAYNHNAVYYYTQRNDSIMDDSKKTNSIPYDALNVFENVYNYYSLHSKDNVINSNYWNFRPLIYTYDNYKGENKEEFYDTIHNLLVKLYIKIDAKKHPFLSYQCDLLKLENDYNIYNKKIEEKKKIVNKVAWFIPSFGLRNKFREIALNYLAIKNN